MFTAAICDIQYLYYTIPLSCGSQSLIQSFDLLSPGFQHSRGEVNKPVRESYDIEGDNEPDYPDYSQRKDPEHKAVLNKIYRFNHIFAGVRIFTQSINNGVIRRANNEEVGKGSGKGHGQTHTPRLSGIAGHNTHWNYNRTKKRGATGIRHEVGNQTGQTGKPYSQAESLVHTDASKDSQKCLGQPHSRAAFFEKRAKGQGSAIHEPGIPGDAAQIFFQSVVLNTTGTRSAKSEGPPSPRPWPPKIHSNRIRRSIAQVTYSL